jgi:hypothetical protein
LVGVTITAKVEGFRRCGRAFSTVPQTFPPGTFTNNELDRLMDEKALIVLKVPKKRKSTKKAKS